MDAERFGEFLQQRRKDLGLKQADLAERLHVTDKAISRWERGVGFPDIKLLEPLADALELTLTELLQCQVIVQPLPEEKTRELEEGAAEILETEKKLSWQRRVILWLGYAVIAAAAFVLVYISHQKALPFGLRYAVYVIALLGTFFTSHTLKFIVERLYRKSKPWGVWEKPYTWIAWGTRNVAILLIAYTIIRGASDETKLLVTAIAAALAGGGYLYQKIQEEKEE